MSEKHQLHETVCFISLSAYGYFNPDQATAGGGAERQLSMLAKQLANTHEVQFVVGDYGQPQTEQIDRVTLQRAYKNNDPFPIQAWKLFNAMRRADADVYVYRGHPKKAAYTFLISRMLRKLWVYNLANDPNISEQPGKLHPLLRYLFKRAIHGADQIITQTQQQYEELYEKYDRKSIVVPNGYPLSDDIRSFDQRDFVLWVGRLHKSQKQPHLFVDLAQELPDTQFVLIAPREDSQYGRQVIEQANQTSNLNYAGSVHPEQIHNYYRNAIALVNTSKHEGFPNTFLEAWRVGTPVCSLNVDPNRFVETSTKIPYAAGDFEKLIEDVHSLTTDPGLWIVQSEEPLEYVNQHLSIEQVTKQYREAIGLSNIQDSTSNIASEGQSDVR